MLEFWNDDESERTPVGRWLAGGIEVGAWVATQSQVGWLRVMMIDRKIADVAIEDAVAYVYLTHAHDVGGTLAMSELSRADVRRLELYAAQVVA